jgi:hypothetical protein
MVGSGRRGDQTRVRHIAVNAEVARNPSHVRSVRSCSHRSQKSKFTQENVSTLTFKNRPSENRNYI